MNENDVCRPVNAYGVTKLAATSYASLWGLTRGKPVVTLRLFSPFGPYDDKERLISSLALRIVNDQELALATPHAVRDYIFIDDVVEIAVEATRKARESCGEVFNVGSGKEHTVEHIVHTVVGILGSEKKVQWGNATPRPGESRKWEADMEKTFAFFNWRPKYSLEEGLRRTTDWFKENRHFYIPRIELPLREKATIVPKKISVVIPCYNEEKNIPEMYRRLTDVLHDCVANHELIFVDDGSKDGSHLLLKEMAQKDPRVKALFFSRNFGFSDICYTAGSEHATGDAVVWIDGDIQDPPEMIRAFVEKWREGYDVVYGVRHDRKGVPVLRVGAKWFYRIFNKLSSVKMPVDAGDFSLMDRKVIDVINRMPERDRFLRGLRAWAGFKQTGIPYTREERKAGVSTQGLIKYFHAARKGIFSFSLRPLSFITYLSLGLFLLLVATAFFYLVLAYFYPAPRGFLTILMAVLFIGSIQSLALAILGEYIGKIFEEVKGRPKYIIEKIINGKEQS